MAEALKSYHISNLSETLFRHNSTENASIYLFFQNEILLYFVTSAGVVLTLMIALVHRGLSDIHHVDWEGISNFSEFGEKPEFPQTILPKVHTVVNMSSPAYPVTRIVNKSNCKDKQSADSLLLDCNNKNRNENSPSVRSSSFNNREKKEPNNNNNISSIVEANNEVIEGQNVSDPQATYLGPAEKVNIENNRLKYFSGLKSNLQADMETFLELVWALCYLVYGVTVSIILTFIPRRFRYKDVSGQVVLITGAGSGIGKMMAKKLALNHGATIVAWDINKQGNDETVKEIIEAGGNATGYVVDVSSRASIYEAADKVKAEVGKVEILINNAGIVSGRKFLDTPDHLIEKTMQVNVISNFWTIKAFLPGMMSSGTGHIVTIASTAGLIGVNRLVDYCASKYAAIGLSESIQNELRAEKGYNKIYTTVVCPYFINTGMFDGVRSKIVPILKPVDAVNDIVAGILTNQEQIVMPRWLYPLLCMKMALPGEVGRRVAAALGISGTMMGFKGRVGAPTPVKGTANKSLK